MQNLRNLCQKSINSPHHQNDDDDDDEIGSEKLLRGNKIFLIIVDC